MNALEEYMKIAEEFNITEELNASPIQQLGFAREQANQMKLITNRVLAEIMDLRLRRGKVKDEESKAAYTKSISEKESELRQHRDRLVNFVQLVKELESVVSES